MPNQTRNIPSYNPAATDTPFGIFELFVRQYMNGHLAVLQPVQIVSVGASGKFVNVKPLIGHYNTENKPIPITDADIIPNIPYMHPFGENGRMAFPPAVGDQGLLIACNFDTTNYKATHGETTTNTGRSFNWSDGFFLPLSFQEAPANFLFQNGGTSIEMTKDTINIAATTTNVSGNVNLADGGPGVARLGDQITIVFPSPPVANVPYTGTITSASTKVTAG